MPFRDMLTLVSQVTVVKTISTNDGMGGETVTTSSSIIPLAALWQNGSVNRWLYDKYQKNSTHQLAFETGAYVFGALVSGSTVVETVQYNLENYKTVGYCDDVMQLGEISVQSLERMS